MKNRRKMVTLCYISEDKKKKTGVFGFSMIEIGIQ
jgi:hypothetical protein